MKFKYVCFRVPQDVETCEEDFQSVENPLPYNDLPDGEYLIRGDKKAHRKEYWKVEGRWFLITDVTKDNGHWYCDATEYMLFPSLPEKEWKKMLSIPIDRFTMTWRRWIYAYGHWQNLRRISKDMRLWWLRHDKIK